MMQTSLAQSAAAAAASTFDAAARRRQLSWGATENEFFSLFLLGERIFTAQLPEGHHSEKMSISIILVSGDQVHAVNGQITSATTSAATPPTSEMAASKPPVDPDMNSELQDGKYKH
jgi:hypothetical protein